MLGIKLDVKPFLERVGQELLRIDTASVKSLADQIYKRYETGKFVFIIGNGGSGSNASHFCEDMGKGTIRREDFDNDHKKRLKILSLTDNTPIGWGMTGGSIASSSNNSRTWQTRATCSSPSAVRAIAQTS